MNKLLKVISVSALLFFVLVLSVPVARAATIAEIQEQISAISTKIQALLEQIAALTNKDCMNLWWIDNSNTTCQSQKLFCGAYMYQGLETFSNTNDCVSAAAKKAACIPDWKCDWTSCEKGFKSKIPIDSNKCGLAITKANIFCDYAVQQCASQSSKLNFTFLSAEANIIEYGLTDYIATGTIRFKVKLTGGTMEKFLGAEGTLDKTKPMVVINAYDSDDKIITGENTTYRYIDQAPFKTLVGVEEAIITVQQTLNFSSKNQIKSMKFKIDSINYSADNILESYTDTGGWTTNLATLPTISQKRLNFMASIAEAIKKATQLIGQLSK